MNSFVNNYYDGFLECINNLTKVIKWNAFGYQNFLRFRAIILLIHKYKKIGTHVSYGEESFTSFQHLTENQNYT
ncbi:transposase [Psychrobacillus psychrotolerans]|uniref:transposase n=1 Tax=Psychrobacillus psychrotolerans TaxID=126156 RepID=UPI0033162A29